MKKFLFAFGLIFISALSYAQPKIGLTFAPGVSLNRVKYKSADTDIDVSKFESAFRFKFGLEADFMLTETYAFSTGIFYAPKRLGLTHTVGSITTTEEYRIQYVQIPITMKLYTSEIQPDIKAFFHLGFLFEIKAFDEPYNESYTLVDEFEFFDVAFQFGMGIEYGAGVNSILYAGLYYDRGLVNVVKRSTTPEDIVAKIDMLNLRLGIKF